jgi:hypothetical protein
MTAQYTALANVTLGSSAATVTFSSISQAYRDLVLVVQAKGASGNSAIAARFNSDAGSNYSHVFMYGDGSSTASIIQTSTAAQTGSASATTSLSSSVVLNIMDYSATDKQTTFLVRSNEREASFTVTAVAGRWANSSAITTVSFAAANSYAAGSTFALYGVK